MLAHLVGIPVEETALSPALTAATSGDIAGNEVREPIAPAAVLPAPAGQSPEEARMSSVRPPAPRLAPRALRHRHRAQTYTARPATDA